MAFLLVGFDDSADILRECGVQLRQPDGDVLVYGGFGNAEDLGGSADSCAVLCNICAEKDCAFFERMGTAVWKVLLVFHTVSLLVPAERSAVCCTICSIPRKNEELVMRNEELQYALRA